MITVKFYDNIDDAKLKFAVIAARYANKWVLCRHKKRNTYELPGGHREPGETIRQTAERELWEETGAITYHLSPICVYSVTEVKPPKQTGQETFGMLYYAEVKQFGPMPDSEIEEYHLFSVLPSQWTYPLIQPKLIERVLQTGHAK